MKITQERLKHLLDYDPHTGVFTWKNPPPKSKPKKGDIAGCEQIGYVSIKLDRKPYLAHRLAFLFMIGRFPPDDTDHVNGVRSDNRFENLRECTRAENGRNKRKPVDNTSGFKGVYTLNDGKTWLARIGANNVRKQLGSFPTKAAAAKAYDVAARELHGVFARTSEAA